jgi:hypothetical protein
MAALRCEEHRPKSRDSEGLLKYRFAADPLGKPGRPILCAIKGCGKLAKLWLDVNEANHYEAGQRTFQMFNSVIQVADGGSIRKE